jgi:hypothetical protein
MHGLTQKQVVSQMRLVWLLDYTPDGNLKLSGDGMGT